MRSTMSSEQPGRRVTEPECRKLSVFDRMLNLMCAQKSDVPFYRSRKRMHSRVSAAGSKESFDSVCHKQSLQSNFSVFSSRQSQRVVTPRLSAASNRLLPHPSPPAGFRGRASTASHSSAAELHSRCSVKSRTSSASKWRNHQNPVGNDPFAANTVRGQERHHTGNNAELALACKSAMKSGIVDSKRFMEALDYFLDEAKENIANEYECAVSEASKKTYNLQQEVAKLKAREVARKDRETEDLEHPIKDEDKKLERYVVKKDRETEDEEHQAKNEDKKRERSVGSNIFEKQATPERQYSPEQASLQAVLSDPHLVSKHEAPPPVKQSCSDAYCDVRTGSMPRVCHTCSDHSEEGVAKEAYTFSHESSSSYGIVLSPPNGNLEANHQSLSSQNCESVSPLSLSNMPADRESAMVDDSMERMHQEVLDSVQRLKEMLEPPKDNQEYLPGMMTRLSLPASQASKQVKVGNSPKQLTDVGSDEFVSRQSSAMIVEAFVLWPAWLSERDLPDVNGSTAIFTKGHLGMSREDWDTLSEDEYEPPGADMDSWCESFKLRPSSPLRIVWDVLTCLLVVYDCVMLPMQLFEMRKTFVGELISWICRIFWSIDLPLNFFTGIRHDTGEVDMNMRHIAKKYIKSWFGVDLVVLGIEWVEYCSTANSARGMAAARIGKIIKVLRLLRMVRMLRVLKTVRLPDFVKDVAGSVLGILKLVVFVVWVNHLLACLWYGIAQMHDGSDNWLVSHGMQHAPISYQYTTAFHWSLTQFIGSMDVQPHNVTERIFAIVVLVWAFLFSAWVVSSITSSMTRLEILTASQSTKVAALKQFLSDQGISRRTARRVMHNAQQELNEIKRNTPEENIELLQLVSEPLRVDIHFEVRMPILGMHPFMDRYAQRFTSVMRQVCHVAISSLKFSRSDVLFSAGEVPPIGHMYFIVSGRLSYVQPPKGVRVNGEGDSVDDDEFCHSSITHINQHGWACEAVLWTPWAHAGTLRASTDTSVIVVDAEMFRNIIKGSQQGIAVVTRYADFFVNHLNDDPCLVSDLLDQRLNWDDAVDQIFERAEEEAKKRFAARGAKKRRAPSTCSMNSVSSNRDTVASQGSRYLTTVVE